MQIEKGEERVETVEDRGEAGGRQERLERGEEITESRE